MLLEIADEEPPPMRADHTRPPRLRGRRAVFATGLALCLIAPGGAHAWPTPATAVPSTAARTPPKTESPSNPHPTQLPAAPAAALSSRPPLDAAGALERARAAYEYGDIDEMVESARQVSDGRLHPSPAQRANALRYLGIGLFLTGRAEGAETAFFELLRLRPESRLDPQNTRPDAVAFFEQVRRRYAEPIRDAARANNRKLFVWNFLPPAGQIQNGHLTRAITLGGIELVSLGTNITTYALLKHWQGPYNTFPGRGDQARFTRFMNWTSLGVLGAAFLFGVIDGIAHYADPRDDSPAPSTVAGRASFFPGGVLIDF